MVDDLRPDPAEQGHCRHCFRFGFEAGLHEGARLERECIRRRRAAIEPKPLRFLFLPLVNPSPAERAARDKAEAAENDRFMAARAAWEKHHAMLRGPGQPSKTDDQLRRDLLELVTLLHDAFIELWHQGTRRRRDLSLHAVLKHAEACGKHPPPYGTARAILEDVRLGRLRRTFAQLRRQWMTNMEMAREFQE